MNLYDEVTQGIYAPSRRQLRAANLAGAFSDAAAVHNGQQSQGLAFSQPQGMLDAYHEKMAAQQHNQQQQEALQAQQAQAQQKAELDRRNIESQIAKRQHGMSQEGGTDWKPVGSGEMVQTGNGFAFAIPQVNSQGESRTAMVPFDGTPTTSDGLTPKASQEMKVQTRGINQAIDRSGEFFDRTEPVKDALGLYGEVIATIDSGVDTGPLKSKLPSFRTASVRLDNLRKRLGLNVVAGGTFGPLNESELELALDVGLPDALRPVELRDWAVKKQAAQAKLLDYLETSAIELGSGNYTLSEWLEKSKGKKSDAPKDTPTGKPSIKDLRGKYGLE